MNLIIRRMDEKDLGPLAELLSDARVMRCLEPPFSTYQFRLMGEDHEVDHDCHRARLRSRILS